MSNVSATSNDAIATVTASLKAQDIAASETAARVRASIGANATSVDAPTLADIDEQAELGFKDGEKSDALKGTSSQRVAYAIRAYRELLSDTGKPIPTLTSTLTSPDAAKEVSDIMLAHFVSDKATPTNEKTSDDAKAKANTARTARTALVKRSIVLAAILDRGNVALSAFTPKTGQFSVPFGMLLPENASPLMGQTAKTLVPLDNRGFLYGRVLKGGNPSTATLRASVTQLVNLHKPATPRATGGATSAAPSTTLKASDLGLGALLKEAVSILESGTNKLTDFTKADRNYMATIARLYNKMTELDAAKPAKSTRKAG